jgi:hypothetical protein
LPLSLRTRKRSFAECVEFPRWVVSVSVLIIGFVFWMGAVADDTGKLLKVGIGSLLYFAAVAGTAAFSLYGGLGRNSRRTPYDRRFRFRGRSGHRAG